MKKLISLLLLSIFVLSACQSSPELTGIDLYGIFDENDLFIDEIAEPLDGDDEIKIPVIKGLKDTKLQSKINAEIYEEAKELIEKHAPLNYANYYTRANFANVISISFNVGFEEEPYSEQIHFNYNLTNGEKLKFEDLFTPEVDLLSIVRHAFYRELSFYGKYDSKKKLHSPDENEVYKAVKSFMAEEDKNFSFSPAGIFLYSPTNNFAEIKMLDHADDIAIYSKYMTKDSIFTGEYEGFKGAFTCTDIQYDFFDIIEYGYLENNLWYDFTTNEPYIPYDGPPEEERLAKFQAFYESAVEKEYAKIEEYRNLAKANPDKFYIVFLKPSASMDFDSDYDDGKWYYTYYDTAKFYSRIELFEMPVELYDEVYRDKIIDTYRYEYFVMRGGAWLDTENLEGATYNEITDELTINYMED